MQICAARARVAGREAGVLRAGGEGGGGGEARDRDAEQGAGARHGALRLPERGGDHPEPRPDGGRPDQVPAVTTRGFTSHLHERISVYHALSSKYYSSVRTCACATLTDHSINEFAYSVPSRKARRE